jgi:SAM-dependent methyltransferase
MLKPDSSPSDYVAFYDRIGAAQLEERYLANPDKWYARARFELVLDLLRPKAQAAARLLDIGCASGYYSVSYAQAGGSAVGIDISEASVRLAGVRAERAGVGDRCRFRQGDFRRLPVERDSFDVVIMIEVLEHVREQEEAVSQAVGALRSGGSLIVATPYALDTLGLWGRMRHSRARSPEDAGVQIKRLDTNPIVEEAGIEHAPYFHDAFTFRQLRDLVPAGCRIERLHSLYVQPPFLSLYAHLPKSLRSIGKRPIGIEMPAQAVDEDDLVALPPLHPLARVTVVLSRALWHVPMARKAGRHALMVLRKD